MLIAQVRADLRKVLPRLLGLRIAVLHGSVSVEDRLNAERFPIEEWSVTAILATMRELGLSAVHLDPTEPGFVDTVREFDLVFLNVHGAYGEDGRIQGLLDYLRLPYTTSGVFGGCVGADKLLAKAVCHQLSIRTPASRSVEPVVADGPVITFPAMLKATAGGTSVGVYLVEDEPAVHAARAELRALGLDRCFLEEFVPGRSLTMGVLDLPGGTVVLPPLEAVSEHRFYDRATKFTLGPGTDVRFEIPGDIPANIQAELADTALRLYQYLGCHGAARVDYIVTDKPYLLEINTIPGFHPLGNLALAAKAIGLDHQDLILALLTDAYERSKLHERPTR